MEFKIIEDIRLSEKILYTKHQSGVQIYFCPKPYHTENNVMFGTKYGSIDNYFRPEGESEFISLPDGIAHFLEHKMFENESGVDVFNLFGKYGANANAFTSFDKTVYLFSCTDNFKKNLETLIKFVSEPYFTPETVAKEQGIIGQEIRMYEDTPSWRLMINLLDALYVNNTVKIDIAGSVDSIAQITDKLLYKTYESFYNPNNMVLCISGNVNPDDIIKVCDKCFKNIAPKTVERVYKEEPITVNKKEIVQKMSVSIPHFSIGIKDNNVGLFGSKLIDREVGMNILLEILAGKSSNLHKKLYDSGLINDEFSTEYTISNTFAMTMISGESEKPKEVFQIVKDEIAKLQQKGIEEEVFERNKKSLYGRDIGLLNKTDDIVYELMTASFNKVGFFDNFNAYNRINLEFVTGLLNEINDDIMALSIIDCA